MLVGAVAYFTNLIINLVRMYARLDLAVVGAMLLLGGPLFAMLFWLSAEETRTIQAISQSGAAQMFIAGIFGAGGAIVANAAQSAAKPTKPPAPGE